MPQYDLTPLYRSTVGFDRLFHLLDSANANQTHPSYPPYNIEKLSEDQYRISMAVAGFSAQELDVEIKQNSLTVRGDQRAQEDDDSRAFLHRGIAARSFERRFQLADHVKVEGARLEHGLLHLDLVREVPEEAKPRSIAIQSAASTSNGLKTIESAAS